MSAEGSAAATVSKVEVEWVEDDLFVGSDEAAILAEHGHPDAQQAATAAELGQTDAQAPKDGE